MLYFVKEMLKLAFSKDCMRAEDFLFKPLDKSEYFISRKDYCQPCNFGGKLTQNAIGFARNDLAIPGKF